MKWKIVSENSCIFCAASESFIHVLLECPQVSLFWKKVAELIYVNFNVKIVLNEKLLIIGLDFNLPNAIHINIIVSYAQYVIYKMYMLNYFQGKTYNANILWHVLKNELVLDNASVLSNHF